DGPDAEAGIEPDVGLAGHDRAVGLVDHFLHPWLPGRRDLLRRLELEELDLVRRDPLPLQDRQHRIVGRGAPEEADGLAIPTIESPYVMHARGLVQLVLSAMLDARRIKA